MNNIELFLHWFDKAVISEIPVVMYFLLNKQLNWPFCWVKNHENGVVISSQSVLYSCICINNNNFHIFNCLVWKNILNYISMWSLAHLSWKLKLSFFILICPVSIRLPVCKRFTFSTSSSEPKGQFQPNLVKRISRSGWFKFVKMHAHALF